MSDIKWTKPQQNAIDSRGDILVSAAAGSGKTAVLVERVMRLIESECNIDELLIVTFTRAAAAQMKEKISKAISEKIALEADNKHFRLQQILLEKAKITTIDAFCADVLKNNFQYLEGIDISMNYKNLDRAKFEVLSTEVLDDVLEQFYSSESESFRDLMDVFTTGKNDLNIYNIIDLLHTYTSAFVDRKAWLEKAVEAYRAQSIAGSAWADVIFTSLKEYFSLMADYYDRSIATVAGDQKTDEVYGAFLRKEALLAKSGMEAVENRDWEAIWNLKSYRFDRFPTVKKEIDLSLRERAKQYREAAKKTVFEKQVCPIIIENEEDFARDNAFIYPVAKELAQVYEAYENALFARKLETQEFEFSDISFLALKILVDDALQPSPIALEYQKKFKAILVDEYQDTNGVQDLIFKTISNHNLFIVGDVKQSIYRFRQAMPEIFIDRRKALSPYKKGDKSGYILLKNNFRSKKTVTDFVNFLFKNLMSETLGDIDYNDDEYLIPGTEKEDSEAAAPELHILENTLREGREKIKNPAFEAAYIASLIKKQVQGGELIKIGDEQRAVEYGDYCILLRSKTHMPDMEKALKEQEIPYSSQGGENLFEATEIMLVMSFLRAIDNPLRDVDLIAVMYSEIFGFTAEELSLIRIEKRKGSFYSALCALAQHGSEKCACFLRQLEEYRTMAAVNEPAEFLRLFYTKSALPEIVSASENGEIKRANLMKFISIVQMYSNAGYYGLSGLVRFLEKVKNGNSDITAAFTAPGDSRVKIMSVHASKGLEFPIVIFAYTNQSNNHNPSNIVLNRELGMGIKPKSLRENIRYNTISFTAVHLENTRAEAAEELRTLYVALTRAKAKLMITGTFDSTLKSGASKREEKLNEIARFVGELERIDEGWLRMNNNFLSWIIACAFRHPAAVELRAHCECENYFIDHSEQGSLKVFLPEFFPEENEREEKSFSAKASEEIKKEICQNFDFSYSYAGSETIESKKTPSALAQSESEEDYAFEPPAFVLGEKMNAAQRGTATHRFMEKLRSFDAEVDSEIAYMLEKGFLSKAEAEVLDKKAIKKFLQSSLAKRMLSAERLEKEYPVSYLESASFFDESLPKALSGEKVFVDGMIDAVFTENNTAVIVDYKTDRVKTAEELKARYMKQMELYKRAIEALWGIPVKQCHLYSFALGEDIAVEF